MSTAAEPRRRTHIAKELIVAISNPADRGAKAANDMLGSLCEVILDNWRLFTDTQIGIAATMVSYARPAEMLTRRQKFRLDQAVEIIRSRGLAEV